jgi:hypothetical protein
MKFHEFLDVIYRNKNLEIREAFDLKTQAESRAIPELINWQRSFYKFIAYFTLTSAFVKAKLTDTWPEAKPLKLSDEKRSDESEPIQAPEAVVVS